MRNMAILLAAGTVFTLGACATSQENPFYKYSTAYQDTPQNISETAPVTQAASYETSPAYAEPHVVTSHTVPAVYSHDGYVPASQVTWQHAPSATPEAAYQDQTSYHIYDPAPQIFDASNTAEIELYDQPASYAAHGPQTTPASTVMIETGGQNGGENGQNLSPYLPTLQTATMDYGTYPQAAIPAQPSNNLPNSSAPVAPAPITPTYTAPDYTAPASAMMNATTLAYTVQEGDTVYSLSRRTCTSVDAIKSANGLPATFLIKAGETIQVPVSQC